MKAHCGYAVVIRAIQNIFCVFNLNSNSKNITID